MLNKIRWILGIAVVFFLILATNYVDRNNFRKVNDTIETIYEDRLVAKKLVFDMSQITRQKELANVKRDSLFFKNSVSDLNTEMRGIIAKFDQTELIPTEAATLGKLKNEQADLERLEATLASKFNEQNLKDHLRLLNILDRKLQRLADIQIDEGRRQLFAAKKTERSMNFLNTVEVYVLVVLAILVQIIILYNPEKD
jgi:hypothetical protein